MSEYQNIIDREQNAIIKRARSMTNRELLLVLVEHGLILGLPYIPTREEIIDRYCQIMFEKMSL